MIRLCSNRGKANHVIARSATTKQSRSIDEIASPTARNDFWKYAFFILFASSMALLAQTASIETSAEPTTITIGDRITYRVTITHKPGIEIAWPGAAAELGQFQIIDYEFSEPVTLDDGREQETLIYYISTYDTGDWIIPPTGIAYIDSTDSTRLLRTEPIKITVKSLLSDEDWAKIKAITESDTTYAGMEKQIAAGRAVQMAKEELLRDVKSVYKLKRGWRFWIGIAVVVVILAALVIGFLYWRKYRMSTLGFLNVSSL